VNFIKETQSIRKTIYHSYDYICVFHSVAILKEEDSFSDPASRQAGLLSQKQKESARGRYNWSMVMKPKLNNQILKTECCSYKAWVLAPGHSSDPAGHLLGEEDRSFS